MSRLQSRQSRSALGTLRDPLPLGWPLLLDRSKSSLERSHPIGTRKERPKSSYHSPRHIISENTLEPFQSSKHKKSQEEVLHCQPGFSITHSNHKLSAKIDLDQLNKSPNKKKNKSEMDLLHDEVNRLGILLKAEQSAHQETKRLGALELEELKAKWKEENDLKLKEVIDSYMKLNLEQRDEFNRHQINQTESNLSETKRLENELKDAQIAFELFQAESRKDFEAVLEEQKKEHEKQNEVLLKEAEAKFQAKLRSRLQDQRLEIESDYNDMLLQIENKQKQEIERMASKLAGAKDEMRGLLDSEAKAQGLSSRVERQMQKICDLESQNKAQEKEIIKYRSKVKDWENNYKRKMEELVSHHNSENERLIREITQLRTRLIQKAETIGSMQYQTHNKKMRESAFAMPGVREEGPMMGGMGESSGRQSVPVGRHTLNGASRRTTTGATIPCRGNTQCEVLDSVLYIKQLDD